MSGRLVIAASDGHLEEGADLWEEGKDRNEVRGAGDNWKCHALFPVELVPNPCWVSLGVSPGCSYQEQVRETTGMRGALSLKVLAQLLSVVTFPKARG